jgi:penicillin amidase
VAFDPQEGYVVSANGSRARSERIAGRLAAAEALSVPDFTRLQGDLVSRDAERLVPLLEPLRAERPDVEAARRSLVQWDRRVVADGAARTYVLWERILLRRLAALRIPAALVDGVLVQGRQALLDSLVKPSGVWFDGNAVRARDTALLDALAAAVDEGGLRQNQVLFSHPLGVTVAARERFNRGPFVLPGYADTIFSVAGEVPERMVGPSFRAVFDLGDWDRSVATQAPGQSGSPSSPHFSDLVRLWAAGEYFPLVFTAAAVRANAAAILTLEPGGTGR